MPNSKMCGKRNPTWVRTWNELNIVNISVWKKLKIRVKIICCPLPPPRKMKGRLCWSVANDTMWTHFYSVRWNWLRQNRIPLVVKARSDVESIRLHIKMKWKLIILLMNKCAFPGLMERMMINPSVPVKLLTFFLFIVCVNVYAFGNEMSKFRFRLILLCILFSLAFFPHWSSCSVKNDDFYAEKQQGRFVWAYHECKHYQIWYKKQLHPFRNWVATNEQKCRWTTTTQKKNACCSLLVSSSSHRMA